MRFDFEIDGDVQVSRKLLRLGEYAGDATPVFDSMADDIIKLTKRQFDTQGSSGSGGWTELKPETIRRKANHKPPLDPRILRATGALFDSLTKKGGAGQILETKRDSLTFGTKVAYSGFHQKGGDRIPQRRPVEFTKRDRTGLVKKLQRYIMTGQV